MAPAHDFKLKLTRTIKPTGGPGVELERQSLGDSLHTLGGS
jgi:hypothetical protein